MGEANTQLNDSTSNGNNLTATGTPSFGLAGQIGKAASSSQGNLFTVSPVSAVLASSTNPETISFWISNPAATCGSGARIISGQINTTFATGWDATSNNTTTCIMRFTASTTVTSASDFIATSSVWSLQTITRDGTNTTFYKNGVLKDQQAQSFGTNIPNRFNIGGVFGNADVVAVLDEVELSSTARNSSWILSTYNNQNSPSTFYTLGSAFSGAAGKLKIK